MDNFSLLIIDDEEGVRRTLKKIMEKECLNGKNLEINIQAV